MSNKLVSFKLAKKIKEFGIDIIPRYGSEASLYDTDGNHVYYTNYGFMGSGLNEGYIGAPTLGHMGDILRDEYNINISIGLTLQGEDPKTYWITVENTLEGSIIDIYDNEYKTHSEAYESAIFETFEIIKENRK